MIGGWQIRVSVARHGAYQHVGPSDNEMLDSMCSDVPQSQTPHLSSDCLPSLSCIGDIVCPWRSPPPTRTHGTRFAPGMPVPQTALARGRDNDASNNSTSDVRGRAGAPRNKHLLTPSPPSSARRSASPRRTWPPGPAVSSSHRKLTEAVLSAVCSLVNPSGLPLTDSFAPAMDV